MDKKVPKKHGGYRPGAGRPKGSGKGKRGGKRPGAGRPKSKRKLTMADIERIRMHAEATKAELPLDYMLRVMRDPLQPDSRRDFMAVKAAPYCHPRHAVVDIGANAASRTPVTTIRRVILKRGEATSLPMTSGAEEPVASAEDLALAQGAKMIEGEVVREAAD